jgi:hypothetical protein
MKLNKKQKEYIMYCFKDGVRTSNDLSDGQRKVIESIKIYENMDTDIDNLLKDFSLKGY